MYSRKRLSRSIILHRYLRAIHSSRAISNPLRNIRGHRRTLQKAFSGKSAVDWVSSFFSYSLFVVPQDTLATRLYALLLPVLLTPLQDLGIARVQAIIVQQQPYH